MAPGSGEDDDNIVQFPKTAEERRALQRASREVERKRLADLFVDETKGALFLTPAGEAFADIVVAGVRQTWPVKSKKFRAEFARYLQRQAERLVAEGSPLAATFLSALKKSAVNAAVHDFEMRATASAIEREVHARVSATRRGAPFASPRTAGWSSKARRCGSDARRTPAPCRCRSAAGRS
jgi:hypothetical protein